MRREPVEGQLQVQAGRLQDLEALPLEKGQGLVVGNLAQVVRAVGTLRAVHQVGEAEAVRRGEDEHTARLQDPAKLRQPGARVDQVLNRAPRRRGRRRPAAEGQRQGLRHQPAYAGKQRLAREEEVVVHVGGRDRERPVGTDLGEQAPAAAGVQHPRARGDAGQEQLLQLPQHGGVQLEQERLRRRVPVGGVDAVVVGPEHVGVGHLPRHEPVLEDAVVRRARHGLDPDDQVEHVVRVRPGVERGLAPRGCLLPERPRADRGQVQPDRRLRLALGQGEAATIPRASRGASRAGASTGRG